MFKSDQTLYNNIMKLGNNRLDIFTKAKMVKHLLSDTVGNLTDKEIQSCLCHCWYYKLGRRKEINKIEHEIFDTLLKNNISPKTVYHWFLLLDAPDHIKSKIKNKKISLENAISSSSSWKRMTSRRAGKEIMEEIRKCIKGLRWQSQEEKV